jgi:hypothetical protein
MLRGGRGVDELAADDPHRSGDPDFMTESPEKL